MKKLNQHLKNQLESQNKDISLIPTSYNSNIEKIIEGAEIAMARFSKRNLGES